MYLEIPCCRLRNLRELMDCDHLKRCPELSASSLWERCWEGNSGFDKVIVVGECGQFEWPKLISKVIIIQRMADEIPKNKEKVSPEEKSSSAADESVSDASQLPSTSEGTVVLPADMPSSSQGAEGGTLSTSGARPKTKKDDGLDKSATKPDKSPNRPSLVSRIYQTAKKKLSPMKSSKKKKDGVDEQLVEYPDSGRQQKKKSPAKSKKRRRERISKNGLHHHLQDPQSSLCQPWVLL
ncbi:hypothetical protein CEXT_650221 [Caerostris extrusa]|uniref:Uncharacterized protein n=1 Tax=Caerostris extrusa TaxID=172846 RepID=A0AAV4MZM6_CAEEX|nr:hypothetical protein CEXT_650221 [Caerostris extrusa]